MPNTQEIGYFSRTRVALAFMVGGSVGLPVLGEALASQPDRAPAELQFLGATAAEHCEPGDLVIRSLGSCVIQRPTSFEIPLPTTPKLPWKHNRSSDTASTTTESTTTTTTTPTTTPPIMPKAAGGTAASRPAITLEVPTTTTTTVPAPTPPVSETTSSDNTYMQYIFQKESGNELNAENSEGCLGLGQACPGSKLVAACPDWATDEACQVNFFTAYADQRYGSWQAAYNFWVGHHWW